MGRWNCIILLLVENINHLSNMSTYIFKMVLSLESAHVTCSGSLLTTFNYCSWHGTLHSYSKADCVYTCEIRKWEPERNERPSWHSEWEPVLSGGCKNPDDVTAICGLEYNGEQMVRGTRLLTPLSVSMTLISYMSLWGKVEGKKAVAGFTWLGKSMYSTSSLFCCYLMHND